VEVTNTKKLVSLIYALYKQSFFVLVTTTRVLALVSLNDYGHWTLISSKLYSLASFNSLQSEGDYRSFKQISSLRSQGSYKVPIFNVLLRLSLLSNSAVERHSQLTIAKYTQAKCLVKIELV